MKNNLRLLAVALGMGMAMPALAQKDNVGIGTTKPDQSAALEISSSNKGLLMPRMSLQQRNSIQNPAKGLMIYQTDMLSGFYFFDGSEWKPMTSETNASSVAADPNDWTLNGNANATAASFLGTPTNIPINFRIGSLRYMQIDPVSQSLYFGANSGVSATGLNNIGLGGNTLVSTTGASNAALGIAALRFNTTGSSNFGFGNYSLGKNTSGSANLALGVNAMFENLTGNFNVAIGRDGLYSNTAGNNNVAIGSYAGRSALGSGSLFLGNEAGRNETGSNKLYIANSNTANPLIKGEFDNKNLKINTGSTVSSTVGFLAVGNFDAAYTMPASNSYRLIVQDGIITEKVKVALKSTADWADYVFEPSYKLMSLEKVEEFVKENKHLPNVPSAEDMSKNGLDVSQTSAKLMEKIEELTLYMIEMNKEIKVLKAENEALKKSTSKN